ncbi:tetratricopeptide repeat protein [Jannaschia seosinensis]|uniref:tetratricopeptide repeat protein n=1 Tax=Jannaschia seosinensis TaxID=313367 RepID=UPI00163EEBA5|nr:tetratricopeptide repeat protein [Jannaschia seosinensis]
MLAIAVIAAGCTESRGPAADGKLFAPGVARGDALVSPLVVGDRLLAAGEGELALGAYTRAAAGPDGMTRDLKMSMAEANISLGRIRQAERLLRDIIKAEPRNAVAWNNLGVVLLERGELGEANVTFRTAFALQPSPEIRENLRLSYAKLEVIDYDDETDTTFTLTRRANGAIGLVRPKQPS